MEKKNWRSKYLTREEFSHFVGNDFYHLKLMNKWTLAVSSAILLTMLAKITVEFFWS